jgi:hypothetical protein
MTSPRSDERLRLAAEIYRATDGSRAAVATGLKVSTATATRLIAAAREAGHLHAWEKRPQGNARGPSGMRPPGEKPRVVVTASMIREVDPVDRTRDADRKARIEREHRDMARQLAAEADVREAVFKLGAAQIAVPSWEIRPHADPGEVIPILLTTDQHCGEVVNRDEMEGLNAGDPGRAAGVVPVFRLPVRRRQHLRRYPRRAFADQRLDQPRVRRDGRRRDDPQS